MLEIHGKRDCPFAWRTRVVARELGVPFDWIAYDAEPHDPRADSHNAERKSPKIVDGDFELIESLIIVQYLDELHSKHTNFDPKERARMRLRLASLSGLEHHPPDPKSLRQTFASLESALQKSAWLGGAQPDISDMSAWPFLWLLEKHLRGFPALEKYLARAKTRPALTTTQPT